MSSIMLYGPPGGGKTTLAASLYKLGFIPTFIDLDRKVRTMENLQEPLASGKIRVIDFKSRLVEESFKNRIKKGIGGPTGKMLKEPQGYMEIADIVTQLEEQPVEDHDKVVPIWIHSLERMSTLKGTSCGPTKGMSLLNLTGDSFVPTSRSYLIHGSGCNL